MNRKHDDFDKTYWLFRELFQRAGAGDAHRCAMREAESREPGDLISWTNCDGETESDTISRLAKTHRAPGRADSSMRDSLSSFLRSAAC